MYLAQLVLDGLIRKVPGMSCGQKHHSHAVTCKSLSTANARREAVVSKATVNVTNSSYRAPICAPVYVNVTEGSC